MTPETKAYFRNLEPLIERVVVNDEGGRLDVTGLTEISLTELQSLASFFKPITIISLKSVLNKLWMVFKGDLLNYLVDRPRYTGFQINVEGDELYAEVTSLNCGVYKLCHTLEGKAQRIYLYRLLSRLTASIDPHRHIEEDIRMTYDGKRITLETGKIN